MYLIKWICILGLIMLVFGCAAGPLNFTCGSGEFGPRASIEVDEALPEVIDSLARLCNMESRNAT